MKKPSPQPVRKQVPVPNGGGGPSKPIKPR